LIGRNVGKLLNYSNKTQKKFLSKGDQFAAGETGVYRNAQYGHRRQAVSKAGPPPSFAAPCSLLRVYPEVAPNRKA
jgi:hypothetical protein